MNIRNRNVEIRRVRAGDLAPNSANWRTHPDSQKNALQGLLAEVGFVGTLLAYQPPGKPLTLIDGHLRSETAPDTEVDVCIVDLTEAEAAKVLASYDPLAALAEADAAKLDELLREVETGSEALAAMLDELAQENGIVPGEEKEAPEDFGSIDEDIETEHECPKCGYQWSGGK